MNKTCTTVLAAAFGLGGTLGALALFGRDTGDRSSTSSPSGAVWVEMEWPFVIDQWGKGKAFRCAPTDCGSEVKIYLRPKLGFCNCTAGVTDDADLDRMGDLDLLGSEVSPRGPGRPITVAWMKGRSRAYTLTALDPSGQTAMSVAFNDRCDMIVATVVLSHDRLGTIEPGVMEFLNSGTVLHWAEVSFGM